MNEEATQAQEKKNFRIFSLLCLGSTIGSWGSRLSVFGLGLYIYEKTQSTILFSLVILTTEAPQILLSLFAGVIVDKTDLKKLLIIEQLGAGSCATLLAILSIYNILDLPIILSIITLQSCFVSTSYHSFSVVTTSLVSPEKLNRANSLVETGSAFAQISAPGAAGLLLLSVGLKGILIIDAISFFINAAIIISLSIPNRNIKNNPEELKPKLSMKDEISEGWAFIKSYKMLTWLILYMSSITFVGSIVRTLIPPLFISLTDSQTAGYATSIFGVALLIGSVLNFTWGGLKSNIYTIIIFTLVQATTIFLILSTSITLIYVAGIIFSFAVSFIYSSARTIWQRKVPLELQGRVSSIQSLFSEFPTIIAFIASGYLAEAIFEPLMQPGHWGAENMGWLFGAGVGRGMVMMLFLGGLILFISTLIVSLNPNFRNLEKNIPDAKP
jgi:DHA3 family macrolide efflux protein-like MFS transporter